MIASGLQKTTLALGTVFPEPLTYDVVEAMQHGSLLPAADDAEAERQPMRWMRLAVPAKTSGRRAWRADGDDGRIVRDEHVTDEHLGSHDELLLLVLLA